MIIKVVYFHNTRWLNLFGWVVQLSVFFNRQKKKLKAIVGAGQDENGNYILKEKVVNFYCNHTGLAYQKNNQWYLLHMVQDGLREEEYCYVAKTRNYYLFEEEFEVDQDKFFKATENIKKHKQDYSYGWFYALASFDFTKIFGNYCGNKINLSLDKKRKKNKGQYCQGLVSEVLLKSLSKENKGILKEKLQKYYNFFYNRNFKKISDTFIIQETTPADMLNKNN